MFHSQCFESKCYHTKIHIENPKLVQFCSLCIKLVFPFEDYHQPFDTVKKRYYCSGNLRIPFQDFQ
nr:MAG TPA: hypothetical protein [Caudoviricetes sp.]